LNGKDIQPSGACGDKLIFGPTAEAGVFELDESFISTVMILRLAVVTAFAIGLFTLLIGGTDFADWRNRFCAAEAEQSCGVEKASKLS